MTIIVNGSNTPTAGAVGYGDGTNLAFTSAGTTGQFLQSNGSSAPSWVGAPASAMTLISTQSLSGTTQVVWNSLSAYTKFLLVVVDANGASLVQTAVQIGYGATPTYITSGYTQSRIYNNSGGVAGSQTTSLSTMQIGLCYAPSSSLSQVLITSGTSGVNSEASFIVNGTSAIFQSLYYCCYPTATTITSIKMLEINGGTFSSGTASLYGITS